MIQFNHELSTTPWVLGLPSSTKQFSQISLVVKTAIFGVGIFTNLVCDTMTNHIFIVN